MPRIRFTGNPKLPADLAHKRYVNGVEVDVDHFEADRWIRRGVAVEIPAETAPAPAQTFEDAPAAYLADEDIVSGGNAEDTVAGAEAAPAPAPAPRNRRGR